MIINNEKLSLGDLILKIGQLIKEYETGTKNILKDENELYSINEIIELYPLLSKYIITNAINEGTLKVTWVGNKRYFKLEDVEEYLKKQQNNSDNNIMISEQLASWRNLNGKK